MKKMYEADYAQQQYKHTLRDSRAGISLSDDEINFIKETILPLIKNGVSVPVAHDAYADHMPVSVRTLYTYIDQSLFDMNNLDLRRKVRRKVGKKKAGRHFL